MQDPLKPVKEHLDVVVGFARGAEKLLAMEKQARLLAEGLRDLHKLDAALEPELEQATRCLTDLRAALLRAFTFMEARHESSRESTLMKLDGGHIHH